MIPSYFIAHGAPTLAIDDNQYTDFVKQLGNQHPDPRAILLFTAHWENPIQQISGADEHTMIYDFYGFPDEMYQIQYPARGDVKVAEEILHLFSQQDIPSQINSTRGIDHGVWVVLRLLYPEADIPVIALSVNPNLTPSQQYQVGKALSTLRQQDILIIGSGGTVHNLRAIGWDQKSPVNWAVEFDQWLGDRLTSWDTEALFEYEKMAPHAKSAVPRNEHFIPLLIAMGAADDDQQAKLLHNSYQYGSLSLSCWQFGS